MPNNFSDTPLLISSLDNSKNFVYLPGFSPPSFLQLNAGAQINCWALDGESYKLENLGTKMLLINNPLVLFKTCKLFDTYFFNNPNPAILPEHLGIFKIYKEIAELVNLVAQQNKLSFNERVISSYIQEHKAKINSADGSLPTEDIFYPDIEENINERNLTLGSDSLNSPFYIESFNFSSYP